MATEKSNFHDNKDDDENHDDEIPSSNQSAAAMSPLEPMPINPQGSFVVHRNHSVSLQSNPYLLTNSEHVLQMLQPLEAHSTSPGTFLNQVHAPDTVIQNQMHPLRSEEPDKAMETVAMLPDEIATRKYNTSSRNTSWNSEPLPETIKHEKGKTPQDSRKRPYVPDSTLIEDKFKKHSSWQMHHREKSLSAAASLQGKSSEDAGSHSRSTSNPDEASSASSLLLEEKIRSSATTSASAFVPVKQSSSPQPSQGQGSLLIRDYQANLWNERFLKLTDFKREHGHCSVQLRIHESQYPGLYKWVKRQRYQMKLRRESRPSTLTDERKKLLDDIGFVWDSHKAAWEDRYRELVEFKKKFGHCRVPSSFENHRLSVWVQCQRRQYKLRNQGSTSPSAMTDERVARLDQLGFDWTPRQSGGSQREGIVPPAVVEERLPDSTRNQDNTATNESP